MERTRSLRVEGHRGGAPATGPELRGTFLCAACGARATAGAMLQGRSVCYGCTPEAMPKGAQRETRTPDPGPAAAVRVAHGTRCALCREPIVRGQMSKERPHCHHCARLINATGPRLEVDAAPSRKSSDEFEADWAAGR